MKTSIQHITTAAVAFICLLMLASCTKTPNFNRFDDSDPFFGGEPLPHSLQCDLPIFPLEALYVVSKEYELFECGLSSKTTYKGFPMSSYTKGEYMEQRLIDLFPAEAYKGMVAQSQEFYDDACVLYDNYLNQDYELSKVQNDSTIACDEEHPYISDDDEIQFIQMSEAEVETMRRYNQLAASERFVSLADICSVDGNQPEFKATVGLTVFGCVAIALGSYTFLRALICADRTYERVEYYYGETGSGDISDAFKHITVSVLLRRYLSMPMAYLIMDVFHETTNPTTVNRSTMDKHNNVIGRNTKYSLFRGAFFADMFNWKLWVSRVKDFVDDPENGVFVSWNDSTDESIVKADEQAVSRSKYIYFKH